MNGCAGLTSTAFKLDSRSIARACWALLLGLGVTAGATGCYRHVVRAEGPGASMYDIEEPNLPDDPARTTRSSRPRN